MSLECCDISPGVDGGFPQTPRVGPEPSQASREKTGKASPVASDRMQVGTSAKTKARAGTRFVVEAWRARRSGVWGRFTVCLFAIRFPCPKKICEDFFSGDSGSLTPTESPRTSYLSSAPPPPHPPQTNRTAERKVSAPRCSSRVYPERWAGQSWNFGRNEIALHARCLRPKAGGALNTNSSGRWRR